MSDFEIVSEITDVQIIVRGRAIRDLRRLDRLYGRNRWRKLKGRAAIRLSSGRIRLAELHSQDRFVPISVPLRVRRSLVLAG